MSVAVIDPGGTAAAIVGLGVSTPVGSVVVGPDGTLYQTVRVSRRVGRDSSDIATEVIRIS